MKYIFWTFAIIFILLIVFQLSPSGMDAQDAIDGYLETTSVQTSKIPIHTKADIEVARQNALTNSSLPMTLTFPLLFGNDKLMITSIVGSHEKGIHDTGHSGTDIASIGRIALAIVSATDGKIVSINQSNTKDPCGINIVIQESVHNLRFSYCHMALGNEATNKWKLGDMVKAGDQLGVIGATGNVTGPHLHFGITLPGASTDIMDTSAFQGRYLSALDTRFFVYKKGTEPTGDMIGWQADEASTLPLEEEQLQPY